MKILATHSCLEIFRDKTTENAAYALHAIIQQVNENNSNSFKAADAYMTKIAKDLFEVPENSPANYPKFKKEKFIKGKRLLEKMGIIAFCSNPEGPYKVRIYVVDIEKIQQALKSICDKD